MHIGLIGGLGPAATISYYTRLIAAFKKADLPLSLTIEHADMNALLQRAAEDQRTAQAEVFATHLDRLPGAGSDIALITAITGHFCFEETQAISPMTLMDGTGIIETYCHDNGIKTLGILGSRTTLETNLFGLLKTVEVVVPQDRFESVWSAYMKMAETGICSEEQRMLFFEAGQAMIDDQQADAVLLAGTDLGLAFDNQTPEFRVIDVIELHINALVSMVAVGGLT
ncbi:aspartate racemase [Yoonia rosea]|uniref:Aspartate racemase n=1 Tax=Yoonia rosea TaxID=287098 RepID=A0A1R3W8A6_9RHOB|nr:aspartate/glutamate racemase family protein [Yoonia rosea]SIT74227.1 aspartate racemase [Yoonia rosea]